MPNHHLDQAELTDHAALQLRRRGLEAALVQAVLRDPEQVVRARPGRVVAQSRLAVRAAGTVYLVRVVVDADRWPPEVVTVYRTRRFNRYGSIRP